jgi:predicted nucleic acid-binding protein
MEERGAGVIVVDANLIGYLFIQGEFTSLAVRVFEKDPDWYAPFLWQSEVRSVLSKYLRHDLLTLGQTCQIMDDAHNLMMERERLVSSTSVLDLVTTSKCTSYDCEYVALAKDMNLTLVTFDRQVVQEFSKLAIFPKDFLNFL